MAKEPTDNKTPNSSTPGAGAAAGNGGDANQTPATLNVLAQYVKDLSFENPGAPLSLKTRDKAPNININVNVNANPMADKEFDVTLALNAKAEIDNGVLFNVELVYGGVFRIDGFPQEHMLPLLFIECPRLLFPFARQVVADATRQGGFPPLMIDPIDFAQMFQQRMAQEQAKAGQNPQVQTS
jgi:preprotein translocase subunit SecB